MEIMFLIAGRLILAFLCVRRDSKRSKILWAIGDFFISYVTLNGHFIFAVTMTLMLYAAGLIVKKVVKEHKTAAVYLSSALVIALPSMMVGGALHI